MNAWSVPSLTLVRKLYDVVVEEDDELVTIREEGDKINIYFREVPPRKQTRVNFKLQGFFSAYFAIRAEDLPLVSLLLSEPIDELSEILESHDIFAPDKLDGGLSNAQTLATTDNSGPIERRENLISNEDATESNGSSSGEGEEQDATDSDGEGGSILASMSNLSLYPRTLRELIPSHQTRVENVIRRAGNYQLSNSFVADAHNRSTPEGGGEASGPSENTATAAYSQSSRRHSSNQRPSPSSTLFHSGSGGTSARNGPRVRAHISPPSSPSPSPGRSQLRGTIQPRPVQDIRFREIGFLGESFVCRYHHQFPY